VVFSLSNFTPFHSSMYLKHFSVAPALAAGSRKMRARMRSRTGVIVGIILEKEKSGDRLIFKVGCEGSNQNYVHVDDKG
jgi:hypothetical protein